MRPQVFKDISDFTIECLQKLDLKREIERSEAEKLKGPPKPSDEDDSELDPMNDSMLNPVKGTHEDKGTTTIFNFKLTESIFVLERR
eukprot:CAMPEP_0185591950 /NCGR_PEP_ID=MMETSP0434-20130131/66340_1 /TAXON_ID=626734 ORGANISM="Favella taraikaensis, Strain Fe Narragansett Bay" /NCGR_SAMPLE_ID=MMETSP0434 /ASSEMBLY_ACC=CAM_ASM_000379 /LENGTH=86 /DNA_ID=CAMNT_0028217389 /DNA_START=45 /DNA_END=301 /DNA_ORIENTATION=+